MIRCPGLVLGAPLLLLCAACWWTEGGQAVRQDRPEAVDRSVPDETEEVDEPQFAMSGGFTKIPVVGGLEALEVPPSLPEPFISGTKQGLTVAAISSAHPLTNLITHIQLVIPHRSPIGDREGIARLTARTVIESPHAESSRRSLRDVVESLGGSIDFTVDSAVTRFRLDVPTANWTWATRVLINSITRRPTRRQVVAAQQIELAHLVERVANAPHDLNLERVRNSLDPSKKLLTSVQDLDPLRVGVFLDQAYRPANAVLCIAGRGSTKRLVSNAKVAAQSWYEKYGPQPATAVGPLPIPPKIYWATDDSPHATLTTVFEIPAPLGAQLMAYHVALDCIIGNGATGRLRDQLANKLGPNAMPEFTLSTNGSARSLELRFQTTPGEVGKIVDAIDSAISSSAQKSFSKGEIRAAVERVKLRMVHDWGSPRLALDALSRQILTLPTIAPKLIAASLTTLQFVEHQADVSDALPLLALRRPLHIVSGGQPPPELGRLVQSIGEFESDPSSAVSTAPEEAQRLGAELYLEQAFAAVGGVERLKAFDGFVTKSITRSGRGPASGQIQLYEARTGRYRRVRTVLSTLVDTLIDGENAAEFVGEDVVLLDDVEAARIVDDALRHPLTLLVDAAQGKATYNLISQRRIDDRNFAILERTTEGQSRLRMFIDAESHLVRRIESVQQREGIGTVIVTERFRDYRNVDGLRIPYLQATTLDDTDSGTVTVWLDYLPKAPLPFVFETSIPVRDIVLPPPPPNFENGQPPTVSSNKPPGPK